MVRQTIDFGIDLGTTNSAVAVLEGTRAEVVKNNDDDSDITPSVVWLDKQGLRVGRRAKQRLLSEPDNAVGEFKLALGSDRIYQLRDRPFTPEDLSAEVLKSLRADVRQRRGEELESAVITVPAAFDLAQSEATRRAAQLAGIEQSPLLQEPVAAALAYGFQEDGGRAFWLVYDLGGGTFDAALIQVKDGGFQVVNHGGDNHLGGQLIDWEIVNHLIVPVLVEQYSLADFHYNPNGKWRSAFSKLKHHVEEAKIALSKSDSAEILIDPLCEDDDGKPVILECDLRRDDVERLAEPFILRSINICKQVLSDRKLKAPDVEKLILVGGPTKMPYLREALADLSHGLGIPLEYKEDPLTVVAKGAAIFAGSQRVERSPAASPRVSGESANGAFDLQLEYKPIGPDTEVLVGGKVLARAGNRIEGFTIEFIRGGKTPWRSGRIALSAEGVFVTNLQAEKGVQNHFAIHLLDPKGQRQATKPDALAYTVGAAFSGAPLTHSIGLAQANNETDFVLRKGTTLPAKGQTRHRQVLAVRRGETGKLIKIRLVEGESPIADGNTPIGTIEVAAAQLKRDIPVGTEIEIRISVDESRIVKASAYIPLLDEEFECTKDLSKITKGPEELAEELAVQTSRLEEIREQADDTQVDGVRAELERLAQEGVESQLERDVEAAGDDLDARLRCQAGLERLRDLLNRSEQALQPGKLRSELQNDLTWAEGIITKYGTPEQKRRFQTLRDEVQRAIESGDPLVLRRKDEEVIDLARPILHQQPEFWVNYLRRMTDQRDEMTDPNLADRYIAQGLRAVNSGDVEQLKAACRQLFALLPAEKQDEAPRGYGGTTVKD